MNNLTNFEIFFFKIKLQSIQNRIQDITYLLIKK